MAPVVPGTSSGHEPVPTRARESAVVVIAERATAGMRRGGKGRGGKRVHRVPQMDLSPDTPR
jgi:hypothetical protein